MNFRLVLSALVAGVIGSGIVQAAPLTDVVFGNLGSSGTNSLTPTSTLVGPAANEIWLAQGFNTGTSASLSLSSIALGLATIVESSTTTVSVYSNNSGAPGTLLFTSSPVTITGSTQSTYVFPFSGATLTASTDYWIVPNSGVAWFQSTNVPSGAATPAAQNGSGYSYLGTIESDTVDIVPGSWGGAGSIRYSVSLQAVAVPEPTTYALAAIGLGVTGFVRARRRKVAA